MYYLKNLFPIFKFQKSHFLKNVLPLYSIYRINLDRDPDSEELKKYLKKIELGVSFEKIEEEIKSSNEYKLPINLRKRKINKIYRILLLRNPDIDEIYTNLKNLESGLSIEDIENSIKESDEYNNLKLSEKFKGIIKNHLNRISDIYKLYEKHLKRCPDVDGLLHFLKELECGVTISDIEKTIQNSEEYNSLNGNFIADKVSLKELSILRKKVTSGFDVHTWEKFSFPSVVITSNINSLRFRETSKHLKKMGIIPHIVKEVRPNQIRNYVKKENGPMIGISADFNNSKTTASFISHIYAIKNIYEGVDSENYLIMEDDVRLFPDPYMIGLEQICNSKDWDILNLECYFSGVRKFYDDKDSTLFLYGVRFRRFIAGKDYGTACYLISRNYIKRILDYLFVKTENGLKIDLDKTLLYTSNIAADNFFYRFGNALTSTFPLAQRILGDQPNNSCVNKLQKQKLFAEFYNYQQWDKNFDYKKI